MKTLTFISAFLFLATAYSDECFTAKPTQPLTADVCGPVEAKVTIKDCSTLQETKSFTATMGLDCFETPHKLKLLYNKTQMLVGEVSSFDGEAELIVSKTYLENLSRMPAQSRHPRKEYFDPCFKMKPLERPNPQTCDPVQAEIQFVSCKDHKPVGHKLEVTTHFSCGNGHQELKYWYKKMMLVGSLQKTKGGYKVARTYSLTYPSIYGSYNDVAATSSGH
jgi:hypothetical protein